MVLFIVGLVLLHFCTFIVNISTMISMIIYILIDANKIYYPIFFSSSINYLYQNNL